MNLNLATLPLPLDTNTANGPRRRHRLGNLELANGALRHFREVAGALQPDQPVPDVDAIASAARTLAHQFDGMRDAPCIRLRLRCLAAMRAMAAERDWELDAVQQRRIALVAGYAANQDSLIPDAVPVIGHLDDAVLVDLAWPSIRLDLENYLDFRRLRAEEAMLLGVRPHEVRYDRQTWQEARIAEQAWREHVAQRGQNSYLSMSPPIAFRIH
ncbi:uncharacterized protein DUF1232 [Luteimonas cucumeris]|uniref:Uncharacterized protein DUF1232 n=1 Tax=Luteimonas cucumeris TaxID=985012 RepID=A0A562LBD6_9GAMM|nr:uncharacterized protein DUF1232 [Luteimonas cucumeris]